MATLFSYEGAGERLVFGHALGAPASSADACCVDGVQPRTSSRSHSCNASNSSRSLLAAGGMRSESHRPAVPSRARRVAGNLTSDEAARATIRDATDRQKSEVGDDFLVAKLWTSGAPDYAESA